MNRFLKMTSLAALCALLAVPAGAGAARGDFDLSASGLNTSGYAQQLGAPKSYGSEKLSLKIPKENAVQDGINPITGEAFSGEYRPTLVSIDAHPAALPGPAGAGPCGGLAGRARALPRRAQADPHRGGCRTAGVGGCPAAGCASLLRPAAPAVRLPLGPGDLPPAARRGPGADRP